MIKWVCSSAGRAPDCLLLSFSKNVVEYLWENKLEQDVRSVKYSLIRRSWDRSPPHPQNSSQGKSYFDFLAHLVRASAFQAEGSKFNSYKNQHYKTLFRFSLFFHDAGQRSGLSRWSHKPVLPKRKSEVRILLPLLYLYDDIVIRRCQREQMVI